MTMATIDRTVTAERIARAMNVCLGQNHIGLGHPGIPANVCEPCKLYTMGMLVWFAGCWPQTL